MMDMTFQNLLKHLEREKPDLGAHIDTFNTFVGAAACLVGDSATGGAAALVNALAAKEKLFDFGKFLLDRVTGQKPDSYMGLAGQMRTACGVLCFTAFFEALDSLLPEDIRREIRLTPQDKERFLPLLQADSAPSLSAVPPAGGRRSGTKQEGIPLPFPDTVYGSSGMDRELEQFYRSMVDRLATFAENLSFHEAEETAKDRWRAALGQLPETAVKRFHDQYLELCQTVPAFSIYIETEQRADFRATLESLPFRLKEREVREIADAMRRRYADDISRPLIEDPDGENSADSLRYPPLNEAFVPQRYRILSYTGQERLELKRTWGATEIRENMMDFWKDYLLDPNSVEVPLLVLGDPGSGKSCLTKILCGRLWDDTSVFVRIPLREYDLEDELESIVCRQIARDGDAPEAFHKLKWFAGEFSCPLTLLFDGYDEVTQATGGVYRNLLKKIRRFQDDCQKNHRPVRVVVTSRETLIDKAGIPKGTVVMKLLEFDDKQKREWIDVWNGYNRENLAAEGLEPFSLPDEKNIKKLSGQPLLLLMLAIYDADFETHTNALRRGVRADGGEGGTDAGNGGGLDRTGLYDKLLRRFIRRELRK